MTLVALERIGTVGVVRMDNPPMNALNASLRTGLRDILATIEADEEIGTVLVIGNNGTFAAGADAEEIGGAQPAPRLSGIVEFIEASSKPWVAAISGSATGGGLELALGCHYRVATASAKFGLPDINLGLLPGAGATIRLPRAAGIERALDMITSGKLVDARTASEIGLVDAIVPSDQDPESFAIGFATRMESESVPEPLSTRAPADVPGEEWWETRLAEAVRKAKGQYAPVEAIRIVQNGLRKPYAEAAADEFALCLELEAGEQSKAMRHIVSAERRTVDIKFISNASPRKIGQIAVIGGGTMGAGIAAAALLKGHPVAMIEREEAAADTGRGRVLAILDSSLKRGLISPERREETGARFSASAGYDRAADADLVIEAVFEEMEIKKSVFKSLGAVTRDDCILATNTSYLDINEIATAVADPGRVIGLHFFSPAHIMKLVEVIRTDTVTPETYATAFQFARGLGKTPVYSGVCDGFIGNRILYEYRKVCDYMLEDGALPQEIDAAMRAFGMAMGPFEVGDMAGLDIGWAARKRKAPTRDPAERYVRIADRICELGRFGQKTGAGWYDYSEEDRKGKPSPVVEQIILQESAANGVSRRSFSEKEIQDAVIAAMAAEGRKILDEGVALRASDIDVVLTLGYGFPRWRGGPMFIAENGLA